MPLVLVLSLLLACGDKDAEAPAPDVDGDGYGADVDCDDGNAAIHPGATEACDNGVDEDCDGSDLASTLWYLDADGDGWGQASTSACGSPTRRAWSMDGSSVSGGRAP
jgi:hypothetical protein